MVSTKDLGENGKENVDRSEQSSLLLEKSPDLSSKILAHDWALEMVAYFIVGRCSLDETRWVHLSLLGLWLPDLVTLVARSAQLLL